MSGVGAVEEMVQQDPFGGGEIDAGAGRLGGGARRPAGGAFDLLEEQAPIDRQVVREFGGDGGPLEFVGQHANGWKQFAHGFGAAFGRAHVEAAADPVAQPVEVAGRGGEAGAISVGALAWMNSSGSTSPGSSSTRICMPSRSSIWIERSAAFTPAVSESKLTMMLSV